MGKPIRVLHTEWSDGWGGQEIRVINEMLAVREQGIDVFLACRSHSKIKLAAKEHKISVFELPFRGNLDVGTLLALYRLIKRHEITIVNTHSGKDTWVGGLAAKWAGIKFIRTRHLSNPIKTSRLNFINGIADFVMTTGESIRTTMIRDNRINPEHIRSVPTGADETVFDPEKYDRQAARGKWGFEEGVIAIGMVAVLRSFKRHDLFLTCANRLIERFPGKPLKFVLAGEGPKRKSIERLIDQLGLHSQVMLLGYVDEVPELLSALDIVMLTSDSKEGVPQSVMQAMLMKLPVVATDVGSTQDLLRDDNMKLVPPEDVDELVNSVSLFIEDESARLAYSQRARSFMVARFSQQVMVGQVLDIYALLASGKR